MLLHKTRDVGVLLGVMTLALFPATLAAQDGGDAQANNPLAQTTSLNFQTQYTGSITGTDGDANSVLLRYAVPFSAFGGEWISRFTLPINTGTLPGWQYDTYLSLDLSDLSLSEDPDQNFLSFLMSSYEGSEGQYLLAFHAGMSAVSKPGK